MDIVHSKTDGHDDISLTETIKYPPVKIICFGVIGVVKACVCKAEEPAFQKSVFLQNA